MKRTFLIFCTFLIFASGTISGQENNTALMLIDIQDFYFSGGKSELVEPDKAALNAAKILNEFRRTGQTVIFVCHRSGSQSEINKSVEPLQGEKIIYKDAVNSFVGTGLLEFLTSKNIKSLVICGMQTHMCVEAAVRAASDLGFSCTLIHDACATKDLDFQGIKIKAYDVHYSTLATLKNYSRVISTTDYLDSRKE